MTDLALATDEYSEQKQALRAELSKEACSLIQDYCNRADYEHPINRSPRAILGGATYLAAMVVNEPLTQAKVSDIVDVSRVAVRETYQEIAQYENIALERTRKGRRNDMDSYRLAFGEIRGEDW